MDRAIQQFSNIIQWQYATIWILNYETQPVQGAQEKSRFLDKILFPKKESAPKIILPSSIYGSNGTPECIDDLRAQEKEAHKNLMSTGGNS